MRFCQIKFLPFLIISSRAADLDRFLYCLKTHSRTRTPIELPNDRCCPAFQTEDDDGQPYSSTITGCCKDTLYDLDIQFCCQSGMILNKNEPVGMPRKLNVKINKPRLVGDSDKNEENDVSSRVSVNVQWEEVKAADTYEVEIGTAFNSTWTQDKSEVETLGGGDTMGLSVTTIENLERGYNYKIRVKAYDCIKRVSDWARITIKITDRGTVAYIK